ncbi:MAG TPA: hypothetical protein VIM31_03860 [Candidatus Microsaccharimonas sp.]|jgi:hypothetical protein
MALITNEEEEFTRVMAELSSSLYEHLSAVQRGIAEGDNRLEQQNKDFGISSKRTFNDFSLTHGDYSPVGYTSDQIAIVVYHLSKDIGFGLFDNDHLLPIDSDQLIEEIMEFANDDDRNFMVQMMLANILKLVLVK